MGRTANLSPMGLFNCDNTLFDLMQIPAQLNRDTLINNILAETMELEVLYPNPTVFKSLLGVWSTTQIDIWNRLYATTRYDYNPIENYNRYETGSDSGSGSTRHAGTDTTAETTAQGGMDTHSDALTNGGSDQRTGTNALSGTDSTTRENELGGTDRTSHENELGGADSFEKKTTHSGEDGDTGAKDSAHWIAGFNSVASETDDGLVKQSKDSETAQNRHDYGHVIDETGETTYGKTESETGSTTYGKTESETDSTTYGKTETENETINFGKTENRTGNIAYGKTETKNGSMTHGETITTKNDGEHELHAHGNIGVTTTQQLINEQREVDKFNLYDIITNEFKMRFCILVY